MPPPPPPIVPPPPIGLVGVGAGVVPPPPPIGLNGGEITGPGFGDGDGGLGVGGGTVGGVGFTVGGRAGDGPNGIGPSMVYSGLIYSARAAHAPRSCREPTRDAWMPMARFLTRRRCYLWLSQISLGWT